VTDVARRPPTVAARQPGEQALRGPVDENEYVVGPGDGFAITISGASVESYRAVVTPEGLMALPGVATTRVAGLRLAEAKAATREALSRRYRNVEMYIALVELRRIEVHVVGNVIRPGTYTGTALDPTSALIEASGGLGEDASRRNIRVTRLNGEERRVDLVRYERLGDLTANPPILDGDIIHVPFTKTRIRVDGAIEQPAVYEFVEGDTLEGLLRIAGGLTRDARTDSIEVRRFDDDLQTIELLVPLVEPALSMPLRDGDQLYVRFLSDQRPMTTVTLEGEFNYPGPYGINEGVDRLSDVIRRAGWFW
jgi:protein involved in polysaccharide export with SLBB domain